MPIRWSALKVSEAMDMAEGFVLEAAQPLEKAKIVAQEARRIANLPQYLDQRLCRLIDQIERIDYIKGAIESVRKDLPDRALEADKERARLGSQQVLV